MVAAAFCCLLLAVFGTVNMGIRRSMETVCGSSDRQPYRYIGVRSSFITKHSGIQKYWRRDMTTTTSTSGTGTDNMMMIQQNDSFILQ